MTFLFIDKFDYITKKEVSYFFFIMSKISGRKVGGTTKRVPNLNTSVLYVIRLDQYKINILILIVI